jgi:SAM-dependent methyltransferase
MRYSKSFYEVQRLASIESARVIVPLVVDLVRPTSVIDFGCGVGTWLSAFSENGVRDVRGIDGPWVDGKALLIRPEQFVAADLAKPIDPGKRFDLAISLEVAEHLRAEHAATFVESLARASPLVLFSAAIPFQGGVRHYNEQWPEYWVALFRRCGYACVDCIREKVWNDSRVQYWYAQNTLLFVDEASLEKYPKLSREAARAPLPLSLVHPKGYLGVMRYKFLALHHVVEILRMMRRRLRAQKT